MAKYFVHFEEDSGDILGILNSDKYKVSKMPIPNIPISTQEQDMLVEKPMEFKIVNRRLLHISEPKDNTPYDVIAQHKRSAKDSMIRGFVDKDNVCYMSDEEAINDLTLGLAIASIDNSFKVSLHCMVDKQRTLKEVDRKKALSIAKELYKLRNSSRQEFYDRMMEVTAIQDTSEIS